MLRSFASRAFRPLSVAGDFWERERAGLNYKLDRDSMLKLPEYIDVRIVKLRPDIDHGSFGS